MHRIKWSVPEETREKRSAVERKRVCAPERKRGDAPEQKGGCVPIYPAPIWLRCSALHEVQREDALWESISW